MELEFAVFARKTLSFAASHLHVVHQHVSNPARLFGAVDGVLRFRFRSRYNLVLNFCPCDQLVVRGRGFRNRQVQSDLPNDCGVGWAYLSECSIEVDCWNLFYSLTPPLAVAHLVHLHGTPQARLVSGGFVANWRNFIVADDGGCCAKIRTLDLGQTGGSCRRGGLREM